MTTRHDAVVVGAGVAGLVCAAHLQRAGLDVVVLEAADRVGGRVATDTVDGFTLDRGFQVLNTAYPALRREVDLADLDLRAFTPGAAVRGDDGRLHQLVNPLRQPWTLPRTALDGLLPLADRLRLVRCTADIVLRPGRATLDRPDVSAGQALTDAGLDGAATERFLRPFLAGVLLERELDTAARYAALVWRTFVTGTVTVPSRGMAALPQHLAGRLAPDTMRLETPARSVTGAGVDTAEGRLDAHAVVVAADPCTAAQLLPGLPAPTMRSVTTHYHVADTSPARTPVLHLDGAGGPVLNTVVLTAAAPSYSPDHRALVSSSVLGVPGEVDETRVRTEVARLYGCDTRGWRHLHTSEVPGAQPALRAPTAPGLRLPVDLGDGLFVTGDHRDSPSLQGAMAGGRRTARAVLSRRGARG